MNAADLQTSFFKYIKNHLQTNISLVDEVADILNVSTDAAYRRIRGEKSLTFEEIHILANKYSLSLDQFLHLQPVVVPFSGYYIQHDDNGFENYLQNLVRQLSLIEMADEKSMLFFNKDIPLFHHFMFPELAAFKCYFWSRYNLNNPRYNKGQFLIEDFTDIFNNLGKKIYELYQAIPSVEIWNLDCINTTIRQVSYYNKSKLFKSNEDVHAIYNCLEKLVDHLEKQTEAGLKFPYGTQPSASKVKSTVYINDFVLGDNTIIVNCNGQKQAFVNHSIINYLFTQDEKFISYIDDTLQILLKKSTLVSETGEQERQRFFDTLRHRIQENKKLL